MDFVEFGKVLERNRKRSQLTQAQLAELMGTKQPAISRAESGRVVPTLEFIERWGRATGRPIRMDLGPLPRDRRDRRSQIKDTIKPKPYDYWEPPERK